MADNTELNAGSGGDTLRTEEKASLSAKVPVTLIDVAGTANSESIIGDAGVYMPGNTVQLGGVAITLNTGVRDAGTQRVTIATDDVVPASQSGTWNITNVSGTVSLPTGAATAALQTTGNTSLATIAGDTTSIDGKITACNTGAVVISSGTITTVSSVTAIANALPAGDNNIGNVDIVTVPAPLSTTGGGTEATALRVTIASDSTGVITVDNAGTFAVQAAGDVAHDAADSGNPQKIGAKAANTLSDKTLVADDDRTDLFADLDGVLLTRSGRPLSDFLSERTTNTDGASTALTGDFAASGAGIKNYVTAYSLHNSSASDISVDFRDGAAGAVLWTVPVPAGGGANLSGGGEPLFGTSANTALAIDASAATSTLTVSVSGFKSKA